jgi:ATP-binding cassette subfamily B multidrug efflux pump
MFGNRNFMLDQDTRKASNVWVTLARFGAHFKPYWWIGLLILLLVTFSTWAQVTSPDLMGEIVDCYLTPTSASADSSFLSNFNLPSSSASNCWLGKEPSGITQTVIKNLLTAGNFKAPALDGSMTQNDRFAGLGRLVLILIGMYVGSALATGLMFFSMTWAGQHVLRDLRMQVFEHLHRLHMGYYGEHEAGDLMSRITNDTEAIGQAVNFALLNVLSGIILLVWIIINMLTKNLVFALLSMAVAPLMLIATIWFSSQARKAFRKTRTEMGNINAELQESISAVREVQAFNRAEENIENFRNVNAANRDANVRAVSFTSALSPLLEALGYLALAIVTGAGGLALLGKISLPGGVVSLGLVVTFLGYVQRFNQPIQQIAVLWSNIQNAIAGAERIFGLLDEKAEVQDAPDARPIPLIQGRVEFKNVTAEYVKDQSVLCNVSFSAEPGQTVAIVGPTGAGKTTIINLIPRFYDVTDGAVLVDGVDVRSATAQSLRSQIAIVLQDTFLFSTTVMENIRFGRLDATDEEVLAAAKLAYADTFIGRLPDGYQTVLGERGSGLSQGQRQLLSIARAALANPRILILDEATSSVDTRTERLIQNALEQLLSGRTSFVIAHRLSTIKRANRIVVIENGRITEMGTHAELLCAQGHYYRLYTRQFRSEREREYEQAQGAQAAPGRQAVSLEGGGGASG